MSEESFCKLLNENLEMKLSRPITNSKISLSTRLSMAICWFAVDSSYDIDLNHGAHYQE